ncbi:hypothetical protein K2173_000394 [Erythroxylum novogranatense]|uniref:Phloem protein 2 n=1 Tax=Erythroxylum novogranatense TaxID=1862640 RepID=A0AAV8SXD2_9ROSI|nr:hypothetical protein K2173_000394 [Erythroxylum novogranatense]
MSKGPHYLAEEEPQHIQEKEWVFKPKSFNITWGSDNRYWRFLGDKEVELVQVSWVEVKARINKLKRGKYQISFLLSLNNGAFGWRDCPLYIMAKVGTGKFIRHKIELPEPGKERKLLPPEFVVEVKNDNESLNFGLYEVWSGKWKGGLVIHEAEVSRID